jgi:hypothetical protein
MAPEKRRKTAATPSCKQVVGIVATAAVAAYSFNQIVPVFSGICSGPPEHIAWQICGHAATPYDEGAEPPSRSIKDNKDKARKYKHALDASHHPKLAIQNSVRHGNNNDDNKIGGGRNVKSQTFPLLLYC